MGENPRRPSDSGSDGAMKVLGKLANRMGLLTKAISQLQQTVNAAASGATAGFEFGDDGGVSGFSASKGAVGAAQGIVSGFARQLSQAPFVGAAIDSEVGVSATDRAAARTGQITVPLARAGVEVSDEERRQLFEIFEPQERRAVAEERKLSQFANERIASKAGGGGGFIQDSFAPFRGKLGAADQSKFDDYVLGLFR